MASAEPSLVILIPAYNEEERIGPVLREYAGYFSSAYAGEFHMVVVLNGCRDNTLAVVQKASEEFPVIRYLNFQEPIGKGGALIEGLKLWPMADLIGYVDADGATSPAAFHALARRWRQADCIVGSRWLPGAVLHQSQTRLRRFASRVFHAIVQTFFGMGIRDTQCPAKVARREAIEKVHADLHIADLAFDVNFLYAMKRARLKVIEVPTEWTDKIGSKVTRTLFRTSLVMFLSVLRLRLVYSPFYKWLRPLRPLEGFIYRKLRAPRPLSSAHADRK